MNILVTGATGFVGSALCRALHRNDHDIHVLTRDPQHASRRIGIDVNAKAEVDAFSDVPLEVIVNLAGAPIFSKAWTDTRKQVLIDSRVKTTESLVALCTQMQTPPQLMISGSAMGYYGDQGDNRVVESTPPTSEFAHTLCAQWEEAAKRVASPQTRLAIVRLGLVLDPSGGMLRPMLPMARLGLASQLGNGRQYMPWVALNDVIAALLWLIKNTSAEGIYNLSAPLPVSNAMFTDTLAHVFNHRPHLRIPAIVLKLLLGERAHMLLTGANMQPACLMDQGFQFQYPTLQSAFQAMFPAR
ncbi:Epimerase family protein [Halomonadaceae bacterium LMG 33818]|uniref:TIGR01777 family oxidoreductase n=1 Tax=Cernens ardua TaxID=3402176 RepID=UPI003EDBB2C2